MKIKKILFTMLLICCSFLIVNAEESDIFKYDWTKKYLYEESEQLDYHNKAYYDGGYIITDIDLDFNYETDAPEKVTTKIVQYDLKGEVVKEKEISGIVITYLEVHDNEFYAIGYKENGNNENFIGFLAKMNFDFEIEKEYLDDEDLLEPDFYIYIKDIFHNLIAKKDNKVFVYCTSGVLILDSDFKIVDLKSFDDVTETEYLELFSFPYERYEELYDESYSVHSFDTKNDIEAFLISKDSKLYLRVYKDDKELYTKKLSSRLYDTRIQSFRIVNNYVLIMTKDEILVYDLNGDKVQTIYIEDALDAANIVENYGDYWFYDLVPGNNSFMYSICENHDRGTYCFSVISVEPDMSPDSLDNIKMNGGLMTYSSTTKENNYRYKMHDQVWYLPINVITKTDGNGQVEAIDTARYGDVVTFKVTPNKGYVLESVKVTDSNGNVVVFTDYTFTMPSSDVTIEATFIREENNPDTTDIAIIGCIIIIVTGVILTLLNFRKLKELE